jgi:hypothetical protein
MRKLFYLTASQREHVLRHFHANDMAGSHFYIHVFASPEGLVDFINSVEPQETIPQSKTRVAFCFAHFNGQAVGTSGLAKRSELQKEQITRLVREGYTIEVGIVDQLPETCFFCVIADDFPEGLSVITAFPGGYARPFAQKSQPREEYELNKKFWEEHVLLKQQNTMQ